MGAIAARLADIVTVTSDNPRSEDPERIIEEIMDGVTEAKSEAGSYAGASGSVRAITDRRVAIEQTISAARAGDVVVLAGKGHEQGQEFAAGLKLPFDDVTVARELLGTASRVGDQTPSQ